MPDRTRPAVHSTVANSTQKSNTINIQTRDEEERGDQKVREGGSQCETKGERRTVLENLIGFFFCATKERICTTDRRI